MKLVARAIAAASILLGLFLVTRTYLLESRYDKTMPRGRDLPSGRTTAVTIRHDTTVYVAEAEARALDTSRTYFTFGWPFVILGVLLVVSSRERRPPVDVAPESESPWTARR